MELRILFKKIHLSTVTRMRDVSHDSLVLYHVYEEWYMKEFLKSGFFLGGGVTFSVVDELKDKTITSHIRLLFILIKTCSINAY